MKLSLRQTPDLPDVAHDFHRLHESYLKSVVNLCSYIKNQLELIDVIEIDAPTNNTSLLFRMIESTQSIDEKFIQKKLQNDEILLKQILDELVKMGEIDVKDGIIFSKRGKPKTVVGKVENNSRRISFANTKFFDGDQLLHVDRLKEMSDLDFLLSLNAYYLPYLNGSKNRSMYESFYNVFIQKLTEKGASISFTILQESIYMIYIVTEFTVAIVECILEIINIVNTRIKTAQLTTEVKLMFAEIDNPLLDHLMTIMDSTDKIYHEFKSKKLLTSTNDREVMRSSKNVSWLTKVENYSEALANACELYKASCSAFQLKLDQLKDSVVSRVGGGCEGNGEVEKEGELKGFLNNMIIYVNEAMQFINFVEKDGGAYNSSLSAGLQILKFLDLMEQKYPVKYGGVVTPRSARNGGNTSNSSAEASPRSDIEGKEVNSPRRSRFLGFLRK